MKKPYLAHLIVAASAVLASQAFASGYGPAPFNDPLAGAPASQRGQSVQTVAAERSEAVETNYAQRAYGGVAYEHSHAGGRSATFAPAGGLFTHH
ncbi:hypothetical protein [Paraburkholderia pallida]|uniref:Uncharacterized protein n=1 Tax=Paraburkholderia pallida TaxID=2547399 RepID=A0A4P7CZ44_9BURK|nr:hypothetical protein [Paraburkholderia pallida]QBR01611.1 hypothetical protein E1956_31065 [Paraburkholderia pallida]